MTTATSTSRSEQNHQSSSAKPHKARKKLSSYIITRISAAFAILIILLAVAMAVLVYYSLDTLAQQSLSFESTQLADYLKQKISERKKDSASSTYDTCDIAAEILNDDVLIASSEIRVTLIDSDGTVAYDSIADSSSMESHAMRPEVIEAIQNGESTQGRYSETLGQETVYHAVLLEDGVVVRLSLTQASIWGVMKSAMYPAIVVICAIIAAAWIIVRMTTKKITSSLESLDLDHPMDNKNVAEEIAPLLERLENQRKRLAAQESERRRFTSSASHELKTPLTVVSGYAEIISNGIAKAEDVQHFAELIHQESVHMKTIVDDLLILTRLDEAADSADSADQIKTDDKILLGDIAKNAVENLKPSAQRANVSLAVIVPDGIESPVIYVCGNQRMLQELARNLIENAIRYNMDGGEVVVEVERNASGHPVLRVSDTGVGIPVEYREKIFERFFCVDESRSKETGGTGLGLAIVKHAAMIHKAQIVVRDNEPVGSIFEVIFPLQEN